MAVRNITITLDEHTVAQARRAAAAQGVSLSRFIGAALRAQMSRSSTYEAAMNRFFAREAELRPLTKPGESLPTRDEIYDRPVFRRR